MDERTNTFIAELYIWGKSSRDYCDWAVECLENDIDTKSIRILASMFQDEYTYENEFYFRRCLSELNWKFPKEENCVKRYGRYLAKQIVENKTDPFEGYNILQQIYYDSDYNEDFAEWGYLYIEDYHLTDKQFRKEIVKVAERFLKGEKYTYAQNTEEKPLDSKVERKVEQEQLSLDIEKHEDSSFWSKIRKMFS